MKKKFPISYTKDLIIPFAFSIVIILIMGTDAYIRSGLGAVILTVFVFALICGGLCLITLKALNKRKGGKKNDGRHNDGD
jgi:hypothetical protein